MKFLRFFAISIKILRFFVLGADVQDCLLTLAELGYALVPSFDNTT